MAFNLPLTLRRIAVLAVGLACVAVLGSGLAAAQEADPAVLAWRDAPLDVALVELAEAAGLEFVFAHRLVEGRRVTAEWKRGDEPDAALAAMLAGTGLRAERLRPRQFIVIAEPLNVAVEGDDPAAYTGVLEGWVVDAETGAPLPGAIARLVDLDLGGLADAEGFFAVSDLPTGEYDVRFSHVGYRPVRVRLAVYPLSPQLPPTIRLRAVAVPLPAQSVRAVPPPAPSPGLTDLAARQAAALPVGLGEGDLLRTLDWLPGVTRSAGAGGALVVRGADPGLARVLRDGVPLLDPWHAAGIASTFQPEALRGVRFHRGSLPAELGGGLAAVLEVDSRDGLGLDRPSGAAALGPLAARVVAEAPLGPDAGAMLALRRSTLGWPVVGWPFAPALRRDGGALVLDPLADGSGEGAGTPVAYHFSDAEAALAWRPAPGHRLALTAYAGGDRLDAGGPADTLDVDARWGNRLAALRWRTVGRRTALNTALYHTRYDAREAVALGGSDRRYEVAVAESGLRLDSDHFRSLRREWRAGGLVAARTLDAAGSDPEDARGLEVAVYAQDVWRPAERWQIETGLRAEGVWPGRHLSLSPRLFARWNVYPERLYVRGGVSRQTQALFRLADGPTPDLAPVAGRWALAGRALAPASAWQVGLGAEWAPADGLAFSAEGYARRTSGAPEPVGVGRWRPAEGRAAGLEVAARADRGPWVLGLSYALARAETERFDADGWRPGRFDRPHALGLVAERRGARWSAAARLDLQSGAPDPVGGRTPPLVRLDLSVGYRFDALGARWDAFARAQPATHASSAVPPAVGVPAWPVATNGSTFPAWPLLGLKVSW